MNGKRDKLTLFAIVCTKHRDTYDTNAGKVPKEWFVEVVRLDTFHKQYSVGKTGSIMFESEVKCKEAVLFINALACKIKAGYFSEKFINGKFIFVENRIFFKE